MNHSVRIVLMRGISFALAHGGNNTYGILELYNG